MEETKLSFTFTEEDKALLDQIKERMAETQGKVSNIAALRFAIRAAAAQIRKDGVA